MADKTSFARRQFINKLTAVVGGSVTLAVASPLVQSSPVVTTPIQKKMNPKSKGYQRTEHVDTYYKLADF
ncbi:MAG: Tat pathway signal protein [Gammaproteobacteria bacterium]|nr:Tat pathway signal protein [Gammaproteobacteria bacterium]MDH5592577.1 Tat pathway signal protein [Gammaproteobacteria bacterium]